MSRLPYGGGRLWTRLSQLAGTNLVLRGTNGWPGQNYSFLTSTNLALPLGRWKSISTNPFDPGGNFYLIHPLAPNSPELFYLLQLQ